MGVALPYRAFLVQMLEASIELTRLLENEAFHHADEGSDRMKAYLINDRAGDILYEKLRYYDYIKSKRPPWVQSEERIDEARNILDGQVHRSGHDSGRHLGRHGPAGELGTG